MKSEVYSLPKSFKAPNMLCDIRPDSSILVGFSGGSDSTALLHMLKKYSEVSGIKIYAAHVNHGIRGEEADRDEEFCRRFARTYGIEFFSLKANVPAIAEENGNSIETAARKVRYDFFDSLMKEHSISFLATAHNANDNIETVLFNLCRGAGLSGMCGIPETRPCKYGKVIRPILGMEKAEILKYCKDNSLEFVTDSTNADTDYTRNKIRNEIIPKLLEVNSGTIKNAHRMSETLRKDDLCIDELSDRFIASFVQDYSIELKELSATHTSIVNRAIIKLYTKLSEGNSLELTHIDALHELAKKAIPHSRTSLPNGIEGVIENGKLALIKKECTESDIEPYKITLCDGKNVIPQTKSEIFIINSHDEKNIYKNSILLSIDSANIKGRLFVRNRQAGDKIRNGGMNKSLKKLMCEKKIPLDIRTRLPIICDDRGIVAVPLVAVRDGAKYIDKQGTEFSKINIQFYLH